MVVLSNNDGCAISRSNEAKTLGVRMGEPYFKFEGIVERFDVQVLSSNYALYADPSNRVMQIFRSLAPRIEIYFIDESFIEVRCLKIFYLTISCFLMTLDKSITFCSSTNNSRFTDEINADLNDFAIFI